MQEDGGVPLRPRERISSTARDLFRKHGIRGVGVDAIAEAAGTNKMTLYRHFDSKDQLVAEYLRRLATEAVRFRNELDAYLRCLATEAGRFWTELEAAHPGDPRAQLRGWLSAMQAHVADADQRGC